MDYAEWKHNPGTKEFKKRVEQMLQDTLEESSLNMKSAENTHARTARKEGGIEKLEDVLEEMRGD